MVIRPRPGASGSACLQKLRECNTALLNVYSTGSSQMEIMSSYLRWATTSASQFRYVLGEEDINRLVLTPRFYAILQASGGSSPMGFPLIEVEVEARKVSLGEAIADLEASQLRWGAGKQLVVMDTNVYLHGEKQFDELNLHKLINSRRDLLLLVLMLNLDEIDKHKRGNDRREVKQRARATLRVVEDSLQIPGQVSVLHRGPPGSVSAEVVADPPGHLRLPRADDELVDRAAAIAGIADQPVTFVTSDVGVLLRARGAGLEAVHLDSLGADLAVDPPRDRTH